jgi:hypothetical protein
MGGRHRCKRRRSRQSTSSLSIPRAPRSRALLIGVADPQRGNADDDSINSTDSYDAADDAFAGYSDASPLRAHQDVEAIRALLVEKLDYKDADITKMTDVPSTPHNLRPTRRNLVRTPQPTSRFSLILTM